MNPIRKAYYRALGYYPTKLGEYRFRCDPYHARFWWRAGAGRWEPETFEILARYATSEDVFYDVGAWIGPTAIYAGRACRRVYTFEPDPVAYHYLLWNIHLNALSNITSANSWAGV